MSIMPVDHLCVPTLYFLILLFVLYFVFFFFFSSRRRHTRCSRDWSSDVCSSDLVNRVKPHTDFKGSIESGLFKMMTIGLGKYQGAIQYHRANIHHGYETVIDRKSVV